MRRPDATGFFQRYADDFSAIYAGGHTPWSRFINRAFRKSMLLRYERSLESCEPALGKSILDVGCGPGHYGVALAKAGATRVLGIDSAEAMIALAKERARKAGVSNGCEFICSFWEDFPGAESFDHVICMGFLEYLENPQSAIDKVMSCTKTSALFSLPDRRGPLAWQRRLRYLFRTPLHMYTEKQVCSLFHGTPEVADFRLEQLDRDFFVTAYPEARKPSAPRDLAS